MIKLEELLKYEQPTKYAVKSTDYSDEYDVPVLTAGKSFILGYTNETEGIFPEEKLPVIIFDDFTTEFKYVDFPFKVKSSAMKILHATEKCDIKYAYYLMKTLKVDTNTHKRYWISEFSQLEVEEKTLEEQKEIAKKLDKIEEAKNNREEQLKDCDKFLGGQFLKMFGDTVNNMKDYEIKNLVDVSEFIVDNRGKNPPSYSEAGVPIIDNFMINNSGIVDINTANRFISEEVRKSFIRKELKPNDVLITLVGAGYGNVALAPKEDSVIIQNTIGIRPNNEITPEFLYYQLINLRKVIQNLNTSTAQPSVKVGNLLSIDIIVPPIEEQEKFTAFVENIGNQKQLLNRELSDLNKLFFEVLYKLFN